MLKKITHYEYMDALIKCSQKQKSSQDIFIQCKLGFELIGQPCFSCHFQGTVTGTVSQSIRIENQGIVLCLLL